MNIPYTCKFCQHPGIVIIPDEPNPLFDMEKWSKILCCDRCGDYMVRKRRVEDAVKRACFTLDSARQMLKPDKVVNQESTIREVLTQLTKKYASIVCSYYRKTNVWDEAFVLSLMEKPDKVSLMMWMYRKGIAQA